MTNGRPPRKHLPRTRLTAIILAVALGVASAVAWILSIGHVISGAWSYIFPAIFTVLTALLALLQWLFPFSPEKSDEQLSSNVLLVDAAFDSNDSPYEQGEEEGRTVIRYKC